MVCLSLKKIITTIRESWRKDKVNFIGWIVAIILSVWFVWWYVFQYIPKALEEGGMLIESFGGRFKSKFIGTFRVK